MLSMFGKEGSFPSLLKEGGRLREKLVHEHFNQGMQ